MAMSDRNGLDVPATHIADTPGGRSYLATLLTSSPPGEAVQEVTRLLLGTEQSCSLDDRVGEHLGCPDCAAGEPHVCPYLYADRMPEPRRRTILAHLRAQLGSPPDPGLGLPEDFLLPAVGLSQADLAVAVDAVLKMPGELFRDDCHAEHKSAAGCPVCKGDVPAMLETAWPAIAAAVLPQLAAVLSSLLTALIPDGAHPAQYIAGWQDAAHRLLQPELVEHIAGRLGLPPVSGPVVATEIASVPLDEVEWSEELIEAFGATVETGSQLPSGEYDSRLVWPGGRTASGRDRLAIISADSELDAAAMQRVHQRAEAEWQASRAERATAEEGTYSR
jgi:hypothetical protein